MPCPSPGSLPDSGVEPASLTSPARAGGLTTGATSIPPVMHLEWGKWCANCLKAHRVCCGCSSHSQDTPTLTSLQGRLPIKASSPAWGSQGQRLGPTGHQGEEFGRGGRGVIQARNQQSHRRHGKQAWLVQLGHVRLWEAGGKSEGRSQVSNRHQVQQVRVQARLDYV